MVVSDQAGKRLASPWHHCQSIPLTASTHTAHLFLPSYLPPLAAYTRVLRLQPGALATCTPDWRHSQPSCPGIPRAFWSTNTMHFSKQL